MTDIQYYLDTFEVSIPQLEKVTAKALSHGGDFADLYFEYTTFFNLLLKDGTVSAGGFHTDFGVGIRVLKGEKTGYAYSENTALGDMLKAAEAASAIALGADSGKAYTAAAVKHNEFSVFCYDCYFFFLSAWNIICFYGSFYKIQHFLENILSIV